jgi:protein TonB
MESEKRIGKMKKERKKDSFIVQPYYKGGNKALDTLITQNLNYPTLALEKKIEGTVFLKYEINHQGEVVAAQVIRGLGNGCDEEAIRLVKLLKFVVPKQPRGLRVTFHKDIYIHFRLPKPVTSPLEPAPPPPIQKGYQIQYTISPKKKEEPPVEKVKQRSYQIQLG